MAGDGGGGKSRVIGTNCFQEINHPLFCGQREQREPGDQYLCPEFGLWEGEGEGEGGSQE